MSGVYNSIDMESSGLQMVLSIAELDPTLLTGLIESVLENTPQLISQLKVAIENKNVNDVKISSHSLKSSFNLVGATTIAGTCQAIETLAQEGKIIGVSDMFSHVQLLYEELVQDLTHWKAELEKEG
jgi:HPt (histidine-containing phosphotransfer) domain-containing protein